MATWQVQYTSNVKRPSLKGQAPNQPAGSLSRFCMHRLCHVIHSQRKVKEWLMSASWADLLVKIGALLLGSVKGNDLHRHRVPVAHQGLVHL